jgi:NAD-dependent deacetylase
VSAERVGGGEPTAAGAGGERLAAAAPARGRDGSAAGAGAERLAALLASASRAVALTGAGVSVPSGIPDFRSPGTGLWERVDPREVAHLDAFRRDPDAFWGFYGRRFALLHDKAPNGAHLALAEWERRGLLDGVITQNIDRLHRAAGSRRVVELHGSIERSSCSECGEERTLAEVLDLLAAAEGAPRCARCGGPLRPGVVLFGELLPLGPFAEAEELAARADLMVCVGSSLEVHPAAALPELCLRTGGRLVIVTQGPTPYDADAELRLEGDVEEELEHVTRALARSLA